VYVLSGTSEFVDVTYELAVGNVNIHVLTTLAVLGTVLLGCALEGGLLLVLFATATFVETRLTRHARGDLKELWATVPGEATTIELSADGSGPDVNSARTVNARDVAVGTNVFVKAGQQVRRLDAISFLFFRAAPRRRPASFSSRARVSSNSVWPGRASWWLPKTILSQKLPSWD
jgi:cation transport ATPase